MVVCENILIIMIDLIHVYMYWLDIIFLFVINELSFSSSFFLNKNVNMDKNEYENENRIW
jgi:hypothetical protein